MKMRLFSLLALVMLFGITLGELQLEYPALSVQAPLSKTNVDDTEATGILLQTKASEHARKS